MGRTNGKLIPFLREALNKETYINLKYETPACDIFCMEFPRYNKSKPKDTDPYSLILKDWYIFNKNEEKFSSYSVGKSVLKAAMKKSIYLTSLPSVGNQLRFQFSTPYEVKVKEASFKEKMQNSNNPVSPLSVSSSSSGYLSSEDIEDPTETYIDNECMKLPEDYFDFLKGFDLDNQKDIMDIELADLGPVVPVDQEKYCNVLDAKDFAKEPQKFCWKFREETKFDSLWLLVFQKQLIIDTEEISEGALVIPKYIWEKNGQFILKGEKELDGKLLFFFQEK